MHHVKYVYFAKRLTDGAIKIGCSKQPIQRVYQLCRKFGDVRLLWFYPGDFSDEKTAHGLFSEHRLDGEWFHDKGTLHRFIRQATGEWSRCWSRPEEFFRRVSA